MNGKPSSDVSTTRARRSRINSRLGVILSLALLLSHLAHAKRIAPAKVESVTYQGIRYIAPNNDGRRGYIEAFDVATNKKLWELTIFTNRIDPNLEEDVQWVFIKALNVRDGRLMATSENGTTYEIDLRTKTITKSDPRSSPPPKSTRGTPEAVQRALTKGSLTKKYELSANINPAYLEGDFNGDGKSDVAALIKQRSSGKIGIVIVSGATGKVTILGAGIAIGNGGDDFEWMDSWEVYSKERARHGAGETGVSRLRGDALLVSKSEAASALIYWNGKRYVWLQQGD